MEELDCLVQAVHKSPKYRNVCLDVIRNVGARELAARRNWREAVKATKNKLHQVGAAYLDGVPRKGGTAAPRTQHGVEYRGGSLDYTAWLAPLRSAAAAGDEAGLRRICRAAMQHHSSTRERLAILDQFYARTLAGLPPLRVVLDIACGLNPLAIPWMPFASLKTLPFASLKTLPFASLKTLALAPGVQYYAYDMYVDLAGFLNAFLDIAGVQGRAEACDVSTSPPTRPADLALILKTLPCLEQLDKLAGARLLEAVQAEYLLVSFPVRSLGGRDKRMLENYQARFQELLRNKPWSVQRFEFSTELAFLIRK